MRQARSALCTVLAFGSPVAEASARLKWGNCSSSDPPRLQCSQLEVPLNWAEPNGAQITLGIARLKAADPQHRIGSLFFNPGGPGGSASDEVIAQANGVPLFSETTTKHFDLIGMDPRGLGLSSPIKCDPAIANERISYFPSTEAEFDRLVAHNKALGQSCLNLTGPLVGFVDTLSVSRDMEAVRTALGEGDLNYLGLSYGTQLGSQYAELFPNHIRAMVLDGVVDHGTTETNMWVTESSAAEDEFKRFALYCSTNSTCSLFGQNVTDIFIKLIEQAAIEPIPAPGCIESNQCQPNVTNEDILFIVQPAMVFKDTPPGYASIGLNWNYFGQAIAEAVSGNATLFSSHLYDSPISNTFLGWAVQCLDWSHESSNSLAKLKYKKQLVSVVSPLTGGGSQSYYAQASCVGWPVPVTNPYQIMNVSTKNTVLMVNSYHDPECSYVWANGLKQQFQNAVLLTRDGDGHTSYYLQGETTAAIDAYLVNGTVPADNTVLSS